MRQLVPQIILENYSAGNYQGSFAAVGLFVDISGFSTITDTLMGHGQHGAEVLARIMRRVFGLPSQGIYEQGGFIVGYAGDAFTALFPLDDDPVTAVHRALAAAWQIQQNLIAEPSYATEYGVFPMSAKVGLAFGEAAWGILRSEDWQRATYYFRGSAVDDPAAAEHQAQSGEIILARNIFEQMQGEIEVEPRGNFFRLTRILAEQPAPLPIPPPATSMEAMKAFFSDDLLYQDLHSEFRQAINVFISLPDLAEEAMAAFIQLLFILQARYGGLFTRVDFGDKGCNILLFWGAPVAYENDMERALHFIHELKDSAGFAFTAGVTYYNSRAGFMGSDLMEEYTCYGWGINLAARLMLKAPQGEIWLDSRVAQRAVQYFEIGYIGEQAFKGIAKIQKVYTLRNHKEENESFFTGVMVGREKELQILTEFVAPLWNGQYAGPLTIWGDPGIGKSRLVYEFRSSALFTTHPAKWANCQCDQLLREFFNPFIYWLRHYFKVYNYQDDELNTGNFNAKLDQLTGSAPDPDLARELNRTRAFLTALLGLHLPDALYDQMDARGRYDNTFLALAALIKTQSLLQPLVIFLEDAQYLDDDSEAFVIFLMRSLKADSRQYPVAIISTARREGAALPLENMLLGREINLGGLSGPVLAHLAETILGNPANSDLLRLLEERSDGNPFFAEQILRYLREETLLNLVNDGWSIVEKRAQAALTTDIRAVLVARLDQLAREVRRVIQTASILGREFEVRVLAQMLRDDQALLEHIQTAENAAVWSALSAIRYIFKHALLRDAAYTMQMQARREELHRLAVESLETVFAGHLESHYGELAYHAEQAKLTIQACQYLELAGNQAQAAYQNSLAADYFNRALQFTPADNLEAVFRLRHALDDVYDQLGDRARQKANLEKLQQLADTLDDIGKKAVVAKLETLYFANTNEYSLVFEKAKTTIALARLAGDNETQVRAYVYILTVFYAQNLSTDADMYAEAGLSLARQIGFLEGEAQLLNCYGLLVFKQQKIKAARDMLTRSLEIYQQINNLRGQTFPLANLAILEQFEGDFATAQSAYEKSLAIARQVGYRVGECLVLQNLGFMLSVRGDYATAQSHLQHSLRLARETGHRVFELYALLNLSACAETLGNYDSALEIAGQALRLVQTLNNPTGEAWTQTYLGHALLGLGRSAEARVAYQAGWEIQIRSNQPILALEPAAGLARVALEQGDLATAQQHANSILEHFEHGGNLEGTDEPLRIYHTCYLALRALGNDKAIFVLEMAYQALMKRAALVQDETLRQAFLENIAYHRQILQDWESRSGRI